MNIGLAISLIIIIIAVIFFRKGLRKDRSKYIVPENTQQLLTTNVAFYNKLSDADKVLFENRICDFLSNVAIRGVDVSIEDIDRVLVASGAIIPIFAFPDWRYNNLNEVLLYKGTFSKDYRTRGGERNVLGMVGDGVLHREMILSQPSLRASFLNPTDGHNTAIHEFAHLIDKADGATDGIPEYLLQHPYVLPWINHMHEAIREMKGKGHSDIDPYAATSDTEFFAVISEYFFERPHDLAVHHPQLYGLLSKMFGRR